jgi:hypothetical protein
VDEGGMDIVAEAGGAVCCPSGTDPREGLQAAMIKLNVRKSRALICFMESSMGRIDVFLFFFYGFSSPCASSSF